ncbi:AAA family ATPase [Sinorhizobium meliloti]|uniref:AAA family ATPase n=1 Tax=Rhizobium meliloti TaxID=382 RepID=UPI000FD457CF|nr:ATP-binding protein [Sinorhizobium meliloti]RVM09375.1 AAA family ATPase [Sinorhizobium meliloti]RVM50013.1 AAA family ATPase [Sinorhizobium meliloti]RVM66796.1 AAA family ATPase [Sinorhizobium meliloti]RVM72973.1 AAA family ATPase [Sinorhizobium meliloti]RVM87633.1 AAA family ATPase [Sinorhizobium meliloti]
MDRLSSFLVRRLRHKTRREVRRLAMRNGLLTMKVVQVDGYVVGRYSPAFDPSHLSGDAARDRQWVRGHLAPFLIEPDQPKTGSPDLSTSAPVLPGHLRRFGSGLQEASASAAYAVRIVGKAGEALNVKNAATLLMLAAAMHESGVELCDLVKLLRQPAPVVAIHVQVEGFERALLALIEKASLVPFGPYVGMAADFTFVEDMWAWGEGEAKRVFLHVLVGEDLRLTRSSMRRQLLRALAHGSPVLAVSETNQEIPDQIDLTCDVRLTGGGIDVTLIADLLEAVYGREAASAHAILVREIDAAALTLDDLAIAIRPGRLIHLSIEALAGLAARNRSEAEGDGQGGGSSSTRRIISQSSSGRRNDTKDSKSSGSSSSGSGGKGRSKQKPTGADVVQPQPPEGGKDGKPPVVVETLSGYGAAKDWALGLKADLADYLGGDLDWSEMSTKLLLSGPPGTGKTTFARALCNSLQIPLVVTSVSTWLQGEYLHAVLDRMTDTFAEARAQAPCILFIDEIDGIGMRVNASREYADYWNACVNKLLELLDGALKSEGVIVVGATNRPNEIDEAIRRSGRLETHIEIPRPDIPALCGILAHHLGSDLDVIVSDAGREGASS